MLPISNKLIYSNISIARFYLHLINAHRFITASETNALVVPQKVHGMNHSSSRRELELEFAWESVWEWP